MDRTPYRPLIVLIALLALAILTLTRGADVRSINEASVRAALPDAVGPWRGVDILYCQDPKCQKELLATELEDREHCPSCGGALATASLGERTVLPADTIILKKRYTDTTRHTVAVALVMSGSDRSSIHRPQLCLVGQGLEIMRSRVVSAPADAEGVRRKITVLDMSRRYRLADGAIRDYPSYFAYWFAGRGRETPYHVVRMFWMGWDRIVHSVSYRWSYITVAGSRSPDSDEHLREVESFVQELGPLLKPSANSAAKEPADGHSRQL